MRIVCLVKVVPDVEAFTYDHERNVLVRDGVRLIINPEDATAVATALAIKAEVPGTSVETLTMAPRGAIAHLKDLVRRGVDRATLVSDPAFLGSDTWATTRVLARAIRSIQFDCVFSGTHTLDGGTGHVGAQLAEVLGFAHLAHVTAIDVRAGCERAVVTVDAEDAALTFSVEPPVVLGFAYSSTRKLPYIPRENLDLDVGDRIRVLDNAALGFRPDEVGLAGSLTAVAGVEITTYDRRDSVTVRPDGDGIETVYRFLREHGFVGP